MGVFGIRYEADLRNDEWTDYLVDSVNLLNERFNPQDKYFYFDEIDVHQQIIGGYKVWDMFGWLIDEAEIAEFEPLWLLDADYSHSPDVSTPMDKFCDVIITWESRDGKPYALVEHIIDQETLETEIL